LGALQPSENGTHNLKITTPWQVLAVFSILRELLTLLPTWLTFRGNFGMNPSNETKNRHTLLFFHSDFVASSSRRRGLEKRTAFGKIWDVPLGLCQGLISLDRDSESCLCDQRIQFGEYHRRHVERRMNPRVVVVPHGAVDLRH